MLLPLTFKMDPAGGIIMMAGIYYGAKYGGSTTSILLNMPGEVVLGRDLHRRLPDGAQGPRRRRARHRGDRLVHRRHLRRRRADRCWRRRSRAFALSFSSPEYFALMVLGLALVVLLVGGVAAQGRCSSHAGRAVARHASAPISSPRSRASSSGAVELLGGIDFMVVAIGVFAIAEVLAQHRGRRGRADAAGAEGPAQPAAEPGRS